MYGPLTIFRTIRASDSSSIFFLMRLNGYTRLPARKQTYVIIFFSGERTRFEARHDGSTQQNFRSNPVFEWKEKHRQQLIYLINKNAVVDRTIDKAIPIKCFVSHRSPSREGGSVGRSKKKRNEHMKGSKCQ